MRRERPDLTHFMQILFLSWWTIKCRAWQHRAVRGCVTCHEPGHECHAATLVSTGAVKVSSALGRSRHSPTL